jgi:biotin-dependent carboxylase-like uncharacterized protein
MIEIVDPGPLATVQDLGRPGLAALGVPPSGAFDRSAMRLANRLVGNDDSAAGFEFTLGGAELIFHAAATVAGAGARCPGTDWQQPMTLAAGTRLRLDAPPRGVRSYLAVRGGLAVEIVLGSRSTDLLSGLGPAPLRAGDRVPVGPQPAEPVSGVVVPLPAAMIDSLTPTDPVMLRVVLGPRDDWFTADGLAALLSASWQVRPESNRIGVRLSGPALHRAIDVELPSEPTRPGALQVPADGQPILLGPDAPVTGGYPVVAVLADGGDLDRAAQLRPGDQVRFRIA